MRDSKILMDVPNSTGYRHNLYYRVSSNGDQPNAEWCKQGSTYNQSANWLVQPTYETGTTANPLIVYSFDAPVSLQSSYPFPDPNPSGTQYSIIFHTYQDLITWDS